MLTSSLRRTPTASQIVLRLRLRGDTDDRLYTLEPMHGRRDLGANLPIAETIAVDIELTFENDDAMWKWIVTDLHHILINLDHVMSAMVESGVRPVPANDDPDHPRLGAGRSADRRLIVVFVGGQVLEFHHQWETLSPNEQIRALRDQLREAGRFLILRQALGDCVVLRKDEILLVSCRRDDNAERTHEMQPPRVRETHN